MDFRKRLQRIELKNRSQVGLDNLTEFRLKRFSSLFEKSDGFQDLDKLSEGNLEELVSLFASMNPTSKVQQLNFENVSDRELNNILEKLNEIPKNPVFFREEISIENRRRNLQKR